MTSARTRHLATASLAAALGLFAFVATAATEVVDGITWTYTVSNGKASLPFQTVPTSTAGAITIPATLGGYPVTSIGADAFFLCRGLSSVTIPNSVTSIGDFAFKGCSGLTSVTIPDSVTSIGSRALYMCSGLTSIAVDTSNPVYDSRNNCNAIIFTRDNVIIAGCKNTVIPNSVTSIGDYAFFTCSGLTSMTIPDSVTSIGNSAFDNCSGLTSVTIPDSVTSIGDYAFYGCSGLTSVTIHGSVTSVGGSAFNGCSGYVLTFYSETLSLRMLKGAIDGARKVRCPLSIFSDVVIVCGGTVKVCALTEETIYSAESVSAQMRENDPTVMDVTYIVHGDANTVNVRALAFQDGERGFAKVIRPETFIDGTDANIGDGIAANVEHRLSWKVSSDWATDLAKVKFEVLAMNPGDLLLPMHFVTIPAADGHLKTIASINDTSYTPFILDALLWLYVSGETDLSLRNGYLSSAGTPLCHNANIDANALGYLFGKMGYRLLSGSELAWVNENLRLNLQPKQFRQYAVKTVEE